jgi:hypothetical protein
MRDVRNLQAMLSEGITDPALLYRQLDGPVVIPDDGKEHSCPCGSSGYRVWDGDGNLRKGHYAVTDDEGRIVHACHGCDRELEAGE